MQYIGDFRVRGEALAVLLSTGNFLFPPGVFLFGVRIAVENFLVGNQGIEGGVSPFP